jgi:hypothetical protein
MGNSGSDKAKRQDLARQLVELNFLSAAQAQLALADQEVTGMSFEEVLLARHWVDPATLEKLAPWLNEAPAEEPSALTAPASDDYEQNLQHYRRLIEKILGTSWE